MSADCDDSVGGGWMYVIHDFDSNGARNSSNAARIIEISQAT